MSVVYKSANHTKSESVILSLLPYFLNPQNKKETTGIHRRIHSYSVSGFSDLTQISRHINSSAPKKRGSSSIANGVASHNIKRPLWIRWAVDPSTSFILHTYKLSYNFWCYFKGASIKLLLFPIMLYANWEFLSSFLELGTSNPFANIFFISGYLPDSKPDDPHYRKSFWDLAFLLYYIVFFSFIRETIAIYVSRPAAKYFGLKRSKFDRFGEQTYALFYFTIFGAWGYVRVFLNCFFLPV